MTASPERPGPRVALRYLLLQLPSWVLVALLLVALDARNPVPAWALWLAGAFWLLKEPLLFPLVWRAYAGTGGWPFSPVGRDGTALDAFPPGGRVRVIDRDGLVLQVGPRQDWRPRTESTRARDGPTPCSPGRAASSAAASRRGVPRRGLCTPRPAISTGP